MNIPVKYEMETGVEVPVGRLGSIPLQQMEVGGSFVFPKGKRQSVSAKASKLKKARGMEYTVRTLDEKNCRVWRIK